MFLDFVEALPRHIQKQVDSPDPFIFPKLEDGSMSTFPSISAPSNIESDSQEFGSTFNTDQGKNFRV